MYRLERIKLLKKWWSPSSQSQENYSSSINRFIRSYHPLIGWVLHHRKKKILAKFTLTRIMNGKSKMHFAQKGRITSISLLKRMMKQRHTKFQEVKIQKRSHLCNGVQITSTSRKSYLLKTNTLVLIKMASFTSGLLMKEKRWKVLSMPVRRSWIWPNHAK